MNEKEISTKDIQDAVLDVFKEFKRVCEENNLQYYAIGGTCIGAVRHSGFIPWDDDLDVAMPTSDFFKFIEISKVSLRPPYSIIGPMTCKHYTQCYIKLQNDNTTFIEEQDKNYPDRYAGVYMDIFPVFGLPKKEKEQEKMAAFCKWNKRFNILQRFPLVSETALKRKLVWLLFTPIRALKPYTYFTEKLYEKFRDIPFDNADFVIFPWRRKKTSKMVDYTYGYRFRTEDFIGSIEVPFEDTTIKIPVGYDRYLRTDFGEYMKLPPENKRVAGHPKVAIDLNSSYKNITNIE